LARGGWGGRVGLLGSTGLRRNAPEEGVLGSERMGRTPTCSGLQTERGAACTALAAARL
jgi:hypothetical protein